MTKLDKRRIKFVRSLPISVKAKVLYEYLKKGTSTRKIESLLDALNEEDGWQSWSIIHFYGFDKFSKKKYPYVTMENIKEKIKELNDDEIEDFHLHSEQPNKNQQDISISENDGKDIFRSIKTRQGQYKLRKILLQNYQSKCALCDISHPKLLITSHIKPWSKSTSTEERVDPCNAILLCSLHDALFDKGFISLTDDYKVLFSSKIDFEGQGISRKLVFRKPIKSLPSPIYLKYHREKFGFTNDDK